MYKYTSAMKYENKQKNLKKSPIFWGFYLTLKSDIEREKYEVKIQIVNFILYYTFPSNCIGPHYVGTFLSSADGSDCRGRSASPGNEKSVF